ncbi:M23 family metallopeptidase [Jejubacter calystegiae]|uniref:M23 family metallopeptidase n=2 Tax=Jejubacter calystegiae TaxID=2579935 RepID=A0A4P8YN38_9ENTR|nr:M23 family metallopeptidase [Jejubacter calystegiae]
MMPVDINRGFPLNQNASWHGGVHVLHTDRQAEGYDSIEFVRAIADGMVISFRSPSSTDRRDAFPLNYNGRTDDGYVLLKHETEIGENCSVVYYSLYMHLRDRLDPAIRNGARVWRRDRIGQSGMVDNVNAFHFEVFCDNENMLKLTGRTTPELDITRDGRADTVYGDIHFYLPPGTHFYAFVPNSASPDTDHLNVVHTSAEPLFVSMTFEKGDCTMVTRRQNATMAALFDLVGEPLVNTDANPTDNTMTETSLKYEYNLYNISRRLYPQNPSAGFELLRFGRVISTGHETLMPANAPLWRTVSFPGGTGMVNLASSDIKKFSDADFPHWTGWRMVNDDTDNNSQCNSPLIAGLQQSGHLNDLSSRLVCHFPLEWNASTFDPRYDWLKTGSDDVPAMAEKDYSQLRDHVFALCFDAGTPGTGRLWHFHPVAFISHFRKCCWLSKPELKQLVPRYLLRMVGRNDYRWEDITYRDGAGSVADNIRTHMNRAMQKHLITTPLRIACFLGNGIQETGWLGSMEEGYRYTERDPHTGRVIRRYNIWYYPWYGRGLLQLTNPENYFKYFSFRGRTFRGRTYPENIKNALIREYSRLYSNRDLRYTDNHLSDTENHVPENIIRWRNNVSSDLHEAASSAGFYWVSTNMAYYADSEHVLERCSVNTRRSGIKIYYRSQAFWQASAAVNLPNQINNREYRGLNGFHDRCCVYGSAIAVLTEQKFPDSNNNLVNEKPESDQLRR